MAYTQIYIIGSKYFHIFNDGNPIEVETTQEDYDQLATPEHIDPIYEGARWTGSYQRNKYDTSDGNLHTNEYADSGDGKIELIMNDGRVGSISSSYMVNNELTDPSILNRTGLIY